LADSVPWTHRLQVAFRHAHTTRRVTVRLGWLQLRIPETQQVVWALVIRDPTANTASSCSPTSPSHAQDAEMIYTEWRFRHRSSTPIARPRARPGCRGHARPHLERMRRVFILVLLAASSSTTSTTPGPARPASGCAAWRQTRLRSDSDGPYVLLAGISAVFITIATFTYARHHPFPDPTALMDNHQHWKPSYYSTARGSDALASYSRAAILPRQAIPLRSFKACLATSPCCAPSTWAGTPSRWTPARPVRGDGVLERRDLHRQRKRDLRRACI